MFSKRRQEERWGEYTTQREEKQERERRGERKDFTEEEREGEEKERGKGGSERVSSTRTKKSRGPTRRTPRRRCSSVQGIFASRSRRYAGCQPALRRDPVTVWRAGPCNWGTDPACTTSHRQRARLISPARAASVRPRMIEVSKNLTSASRSRIGAIDHSL